jgi:hypothetical protein
MISRRIKKEKDWESKSKQEQVTSWFVLNYNRNQTYSSSNQWLSNYATAIGMPMIRLIRQRLLVLELINLSVRYIIISNKIQALERNTVLAVCHCWSLCYSSTCVASLSTQESSFFMFMSIFIYFKFSCRFNVWILKINFKK